MRLPTTAVLLTVVAAAPATLLKDAPVAASMTESLFVYGTLRRDFPHPMATRLAAEATHVGRATWQGRLFDLGPHPAAVASPDPADQVHGDVYRVPARTLAWLDRYEELDLPPGEDWFVRERARVHLAGNGTTEAWVYRFDGDVGDAEQVTHGDYLRHRATIA